MLSNLLTSVFDIRKRTKKGTSLNSFFKIAIPLFFGELIFLDVSRSNYAQIVFEKLQNFKFQARTNESRLARR